MVKIRTLSSPEVVLHDKVHAEHFTHYNVVSPYPKGGMMGSKTTMNNEFGLEISLQTWYEGLKEGLLLKREPISDSVERRGRVYKNKFDDILSEHANNLKGPWKSRIEPRSCITVMGLTGIAV